MTQKTTEEALKYLTNHLWYLCPETVVCCLTDKHNHTEGKKAVANKLAETPKPSTYEVGRPKFRTEIIKNLVKDAAPSISQLVTPESWLLFDRLNLRDSDME